MQPVHMHHRLLIGDTEIVEELLGTDKFIEIQFKLTTHKPSPN
jgi:hypothetical protein